MSNVYILQSQNNLYLSKSGDWVPGDDSKILFRTQHKDEAINQKVELIVKQPELRANVGTAQLGDSGKLILQQTQKAVLPEHVSTQEKTEAIDENHKNAFENEPIHSIDIVSPAQKLEKQPKTSNNATD